MQASGDTFVINTMDNRCDYQLCAVYKSDITVFLFILFPCASIDYLALIILPRCKCEKDARGV